MRRSVIARVNAGATADAVRRERAEWERVIAEFNRLAPAHATVRQIEVSLLLRMSCVEDSGPVLRAVRSTRRQRPHRLICHSGDGFPVLSRDAQGLAAKLTHVLRGCAARAEPAAVEGVLRQAC